MRFSIWCSPILTFISFRHCGDAGEPVARGSSFRFQSTPFVFLYGMAMNTQLGFGLSSEKDASSRLIVDQPINLHRDIK